MEKNRRRRSTNNRYLSPLEIEKLHGWCLGYIDLSPDHQISDLVIREMCKDILAARGVILDTKNGLPGIEWLRNFKDSSKLDRKVKHGVQRTAGARLAASTAEVRRQHFADINHILETRPIIAIRNGDETTVTILLSFKYLFSSM